MYPSITGRAAPESSEKQCRRMCGARGRLRAREPPQVLVQRAGWPVSLDTVRALYTKAFTYPGIQQFLFQTWGEERRQLRRRCAPRWRGRWGPL